MPASIDYMNARREASPASGGTNDARRENERAADTARQRDGALTDNERNAEVAWQAVRDLQRELQEAREILAAAMSAKHQAGTDCPVCQARRAAQAARSARFRQRNKATTENDSNDAIPF